MTERIDRRALFARLQDDGTPPLSADARGSRLLLNLLAPAVHRVYWTLAQPWPKDIESMVHDARVSARRLEETLALVSPSIRATPCRQARQRVKTLRRALGASREAAVIRQDLRRLGGDADAVPARSDERSALQRAMAPYSVERLIRHGLDVLSLAARPIRKIPLRILASRHLYTRCVRAEPFLDTIDDASAGVEHHQLRIRFKRLRYTVEVLGQPFSDFLASEGVLTDLKAIQDALGAINDAQDVLKWLDQRTNGSAPPLRAAADATRRKRYATARELVHDRAWPVLGVLRRAAGHIGPLPA